MGRKRKRILHTMGRKKNPKYIPVKQASTIVQIEGIQSRAQYQKWWDIWMPKELPRAPWRVYDDWPGWPTFLGNDNKFANVEPHKFMKFNDALVYAHSTGILTSLEWREHNHPPNIPQRPDIVYKGKGFKGWNHFLGKSKQQVQAIQEVAKYVEETQILLFSLPPHNPPNQLHISVHPNVDLAGKFLNGTGNQYVKAFKLESGYDWRRVVDMYGSYYGDNEWLFNNVNEMLFNIQLEWIR